MTNVPNLRFKEFSGEWEYKKLGEIVDYKKGYAFKSNSYCDSGTRIIKISDTSANSIKDDDITCISDEKAVDYKEWQLQEDDIIVSTVGSRPPLYSSMVGKIILVPKRYQDSLLNQNLVRLRTNQFSNQRYLYFYLNRKRYIKHIEGICRGNANQVSITLEDLFDYQLRLPSLVEQEKISEFFSLIDKKIELQIEKVEELKNYKKGLMQKIFSQELRFEGFSGEWEHKYLNQIVERITRKNKGIVSTLPLTISAQYGLVNQETFFNKTVASKNLEGYYLLKNGEFAYNKSYSNGYPWGAIKRLDKYECGVLSSLYICFKPYAGIDSNFLTNYFETTKWYKEVSMIAVEGARNHGLLNIAVSDFFETLHYIPSLKEQEKIASFFSLIDKKLELEMEKLEKLQDYKKGLLQQMFI